MKTSVLIIVVMVMMMLVMSSSAAAVAAFVLWTPPPPPPPPTTPPPFEGTVVAPSSTTIISPSSSTVVAPSSGGTKPLIFLSMSGHGGPLLPERWDDARKMARGEEWSFVAANVDGFNLNAGNTDITLVSKIVGLGKKTPIWIMHEDEVSPEFRDATLINDYQRLIEDAKISHKIYGRFLVLDGTGNSNPMGRRFEPGVVTTWKNFPSRAVVTKTVFGMGRGGEIAVCSEAYCEDDFSALRESDGFLYEQVPSFLNAAHGNRGVAGEWPGHRDAWRKLFGLIKKYGENKKVIWLMATRGAGSLREVQESFLWMKSENLLPDVIIVANYGGSPAERQYPSIPEGSGDQFPDTLTGIARWLLVNR